MFTEHDTKPTLLGPALTSGFAAAIGVWVTWFVTHLPWLGLAEPVSLGVILLTWLVVLTWAVRESGTDRPVLVGTWGGVLAAVSGVLILGSKLAKPADGSGVSGGMVPSAGLIVLGFVGLGAVIGVVSGLVARSIGSPRQMVSGVHPASMRGSMARFAVVTCCAVAPLLFVGGLVTSTNSGMAVPDWPNTYGSNMFLYPLGPRARPDVYLEHSHRLFGTLVGLCAVILTGLALRYESRVWVRWLVAIGLALVILQGVLGGVRVLQGHVDVERDRRAYALLHGVLAQLVFGVLVASAVVLSTGFRTGVAAGVESVLAGRNRLFATALLHTLIIQLLLGAVYRHFRQGHALWTHVGVSLVVSVLAVLAGATLTAAVRSSEPSHRWLHRLGVALMAVVVIQFGLGWVALLAGGTQLEAASPVQAMIRTAHQANGALLLALATAGFVWASRIKRLSTPQPAPEQN